MQKEDIPFLSATELDEATVLKVAHAYEQATPWHTRRPPI